MSETSQFRRVVVRYCVGTGVDLGSGGDPVVPWAIQVERPSASGGPLAVDIEIRGDARDLPFKDSTLDFVYSSHLLEDFLEWDQILAEWVRVLKPGGYLVLALPDHARFRAAVSAGQPDNLAHRHETYVGELTSYATRLFPSMSVCEDRLVQDNSYTVLFVARK